MRGCQGECREIAVSLLLAANSSLAALPWQASGSSLGITPRHSAHRSDFPPEVSAAVLGNPAPGFLWLVSRISTLREQSRIHKGSWARMGSINRFGDHMRIGPFVGDEDVGPLGIMRGGPLLIHQGPQSCVEVASNR